jgi:hypothetical protein
MRKLRWVPGIVIFASWSLFAAFMALQEHYIAQVMGKPMTWAYTFRAEFTYAYLWALLTPCVLWLAKRFPVDQRNWYRAAPLHAAACVLIVFLVACGSGDGLPKAAGEYTVKSKSISFDGERYIFQWAPPTKGSDAEVIGFVKATPGAVGYVSAAPGAGVSVLGRY